jgi:hypothetical protein
MVPEAGDFSLGAAMSDPFVHIRMECVRLVMESISVPSTYQALQEAEALVDYIKSGHIAGPSRTNGRARELAN